MFKELDYGMAAKQYTLFTAATGLCYFYNLFTFSFEFMNMVFNRSQIEKMSTDVLVEDSAVSSKFSDLIEKFTEFESKYDKLYPELQITRNCNSHLKVVSATFFLVCFVNLKESTCETRENAFYFILKALFAFEIIKF